MSVLDANEAIADSGANRKFMSSDAHCVNKSTTKHEIIEKLPNREQKKPHTQHN